MKIDTQKAFDAITELAGHRDLPISEFNKKVDEVWDILTDTIDEYNSRVDDLERDVMELKDQIDRAEDLLYEAEQTINELKGEIGELQEHLPYPLGGDRL